MVKRTLSIRGGTLRVKEVPEKRAASCKGCCFDTGARSCSYPGCPSCGGRGIIFKITRYDKDTQ